VINFISGMGLLSISALIIPPIARKVLQAVNQFKQSESLMD